MKKRKGRRKEKGRREKREDKENPRSGIRDRRREKEVFGVAREPSGFGWNVSIERSATESYLLQAPRIEIASKDSATLSLPPSLPTVLSLAPSCCERILISAKRRR